MTMGTNNLLNTGANSSFKLGTTGPTSATSYSMSDLEKGAH